MPLTSRIVSYIALWLLAEVAAFTLMAEIVGFIGAIALCTLTTGIGVLMLRRVGISAAMKLLGIFVKGIKKSEDYASSREPLLDGAIAGVGSILLILPGFVSDFVGFALMAPSSRQKVTVWIQTKNGRVPSAPAIIELAPREWSRLEKSKPRPKQKRRRKRSDALSG